MYSQDELTADCVTEWQELSELFKTQFIAAFPTVNMVRPKMHDIEHAGKVLEDVRTFYTITCSHTSSMAHSRTLTT